MKLTIFESDMGDCLLLQARTGQRMLCDGGMRKSFKDHVRAELSRLREAGHVLDLVYVSHIDNDHISGVLQLLEDEAEWRVFDLHQANGDPIRAPKAPRPPDIRGILHNGFRDQLRASDKELRELENLLAAAAPTLFSTALPGFMHAAEDMQKIAAGIPEALKVSAMIGSEALDIPLNCPPGVAGPRALLLAGQPGETFALGSMKFTLIGPTETELSNLARGWKAWLKANPDRVKEIRAQLKKRIEEFSAGEISDSPYNLGDWNGIPDLKGVTAPNVASLMFMVEEDGKTLLLTGDGQQEVIRSGLERAGFLQTGSVHVDVLKVQHHGSEKNLDAGFTRDVSADHYVFCGNGSHGNPEKGVIDTIFESRLGEAATRTRSSAARDRDFHFWFSTTSEAAPRDLERRETFAQIEEHVAGLQTRSGGRLHVHFNQGASIDLEIGD